MCVGLVTSWSNFSLARNLGRREVVRVRKLYIFPKLALKYGLKVPAEVILVFDEAVVDVADQ